MSAAAREHSTPLIAGNWWACSEPEREPDGSTSFDPRCAACRLALAVAVTHGPRSQRIRDRISGREYESAFDHAQQMAERFDDRNMIRVLESAS